MAALAVASFHAFEMDEPRSYPREASSAGKELVTMAASVTPSGKRALLGRGSQTPWGRFHSMRNEDSFSLKQRNSMKSETACPPRRKVDASTSRILLLEETQASMKASFWWSGSLRYMRMPLGEIIRKW